MYNTPNIAFINASSVVSDQEAIDVMNALQIQLNRDFFPAWGMTANLYFYNHSEHVPLGLWWLVINDNTDSASSLGYHDLTPDGLPLGHVFAKSVMSNGAQWSNTASHELLEMIVDPGGNLCAHVMVEENKYVLHSYEVCDACETDEVGYFINGILVSDFVFPTWFQQFQHPVGTRFDFLGYINEPFQLLEGGFIGTYKDYSLSGWSSLKYANFDSRAFHMRAYLGSRRERKRTPKEEWLKSPER